MGAQISACSFPKPNDKRVIHVKLDKPKRNALASFGINESITISTLVEDNDGRVGEA